MKKGTWSWVLRCVAFAGVLAMCLSTVTSVLKGRKDWSGLNYTRFYLEKKGLDVLFLGSSHVYAGIYPMDLWRDHGMVSYDLAFSGSTMAQSYWALEMALEHTNPRLVVVDVFKSEQKKKIETVDYLHLMMDHYPLTAKKAAAANDLLVSPEEGIKTTGWNIPIKYAIPLVRYHSRWNELTRFNFQQTAKEPDLTDVDEKGAFRLISVEKTRPYALLPQNEVLEDENVLGMQYLRKIVETCQAQGIEVLLVNVPYPPAEDEANQRSANSIYKLAKEYGINYLNYVAMDNVVDYDTDCYDADIGGAHLNVSGAHKLTAHLGQYIKDHYEIPDHRNDPAYADWDEDHRAYVQAKGNDIAEQEKLSSQLMLLQDADFSSCIYVAPGSDVWQDEMIGKLLQNAAGDVTLEKMEQAQAEGKGYLLVLDHTKDSVTESAGENLQCETVFGTVRFDAKTQQLSIAGGENCLADGMETTPDVQVFAFDNATGERIAAAQWTLQEARSYRKATP